MLLSLLIIINHSVGNGSWVIAGVTTMDVKTSGNLTAIQCSSTHLTSFAVLVDVAGGLAVSAWGIVYTYMIIHDIVHFYYRIYQILKGLLFRLCLTLVVPFPSSVLLEPYFSFYFKGNNHAYAS